jgi:hypothetical protein
MKNLNELDAYRVESDYVKQQIGSYGDECNGAFVIPYPTTGAHLRCIAASGGGWDHVSVSLPLRCPTWLEMEHVKRSFFKDDETVMQLHVPVAKHLNYHPFVLHLWRPHNKKIPLPPPEFV